MTRYPFRHESQGFLQEYRHVYSKSTFEERERRLRRMGKDIEALWKDNKISTTDPARMTHADVKEFYALLRSRDISPNGIVHELGALNSLCQFCGNNCVETARNRYPMMRGFKPSRRLPTVEPEDIKKILQEGMRKESYEDLRNYAIVATSVCSGLRPIEIQHALRDNIDLKEGVIFVSVVKGKGTYGESRTAPIHPEGIRLLQKYVDARDRTIKESDYLFPAPTHSRPIATNSLRRYKSEVENELGIEITFQSGRRTYGQWLIDDRVPAEGLMLARVPV